MNIITDEWMPIVRHSGAPATIAPAEIASRDDPPVRLAFARPDWNLGGLELLIGLMYLAAPPKGEDDWHERAGTHEPDALSGRLRPFVPWFDLDAPDGPRFLQDLDSFEAGLLPCERLFIDAPGEKTIKDNGDLLFKRTPGLVFSRASAAIALYTFQQHAPSGGAGNRTSMRGGGPMVTLVEPRPGATLMEIVWANVPDGKPLDPSDEAAVASALPWTAPTRTSGSVGSGVQPPEDRGVGPSPQVYFGMPRRIRCEFGDERTACDLTGVVDERPVVGFRQVKHGPNYGQWTHPNTPYYRVKAGSESLPVHPKPGRFGYRQYRGIVVRDTESGLRTRAACVETYERERDDGNQPARLIVGGWAMDNMKALDFLLATEPAPLSRLSEEAQSRVVRAIEAAEIVGGNLAVALKNALGIEPKAADAVSSTRRRFYEITDVPFGALLRALTGDAADDTATDDWRRALGRAALGLFDGATTALVPTVAPERAREILDARRLILSAVGGYSKSGRNLFQLLDLSPPEKSGKVGKGKETDDA